MVRMRAARLRTALAGSAAASLLALGATPAHPAEATGSGYIVTLDDTVKSGSAQTRSLLRDSGARIERGYRTVLNGYAVTATRRQAARLAADPAVRSVVPDTPVHALAEQTDPTWNLDRIDQERGLDGVYRYPDSAGEGVTAYVVDTGVRVSHQEFGGRARYGTDTVDGDDTASDGHGHGSHVAGIVAGKKYGVAKKAQVVAVRVLDDNGSGTVSQVIAGLDWAVRDASRSPGPAVVNLSLGGGPSDALDQAVRNTVAAGLTTSVPAGNSASDAGNYSPARVIEALTSSSTDQKDARRSSSNYGSVVDLFAPGASITSATHSSDTAITTISGTSMAAAHVTGAAALVLGESPCDTPEQIAKTLKELASKNVVGTPGPGSPNLLLRVPPPKTR